MFQHFSQLVLTGCTELEDGGFGRESCCPMRVMFPLSMLFLEVRCKGDDHFSFGHVERHLLDDTFESIWFCEVYVS